MLQAINKFYKKTFGIFSLEQKKKITILILCLLFLSVYEIASVGMVVPLMIIIINPQTILSHDVVKNFFSIELIQNFQNLNVQLIVFLIIFLFFLTKYIVQYYLIILQSKTLVQLVHELQFSTFRNYLFKPYQYFLKKSVMDLNSLVNLSISDFVFFYINGIIGLISEIILVFGLVLLVIIVSLSFFSLNISIFYIVTGFAFLIILYFKILKKKQKIVGPNFTQKKYDIAKYVNQGFSAIREVKLFHNEEYFLSKIKKSQKESLKDGVFLFASTNFPRFFLELVFLLSIMLCLLLMNHFDLSSLKIISILTGIGVVGLRLFPSLNRIMINIQYIRLYSHITNQIIESFSGSKFQVLAPKNNKKMILKDKIRLENVSFGYNQNEVVKNFNLEIAKGEFIGIVGKSGVGKSTIADITMGLLMPSKGSVFIDDQNLANEEINLSWQNSVSYVPQNIYLINDTIKKNICMSNLSEIEDVNKIKSLIDNFELLELINSLEDGLDTIIREGIINLSGGQKQRVALARAFYRDPEFMVLDEPTSSLDKITATKIMEIIKKNKKNKTILLITHDENLMSYCDRVLSI
jgi:ABC-type multidrug transport system fused ATPase/permease subunit